MGTCNIKLLPDDPTKEDFFGSHREVARAIAELVLTEDGGKAIALEGIWGSGKSTTVRLLRKELTERPDDGSVFVFDAWAHRGDPLRRSFIEEFVRHLNEIGWIEEEEWNPRVEELSHRRVKRRVESEPQLTTPGKWMIVLLFLVPFGFALFTAQDPSSRQQIVGGGLALAPVVFALAVWAWNSLPRNKADEPVKNDELNVLGIFINEVHRREVSTKVSSPDPTSVEFRDIFTDLLSDGLSRSERRLIVAIDNLDRIDAEEALTIWSTMRTFFELGSPERSEWLDRFWLLVPYDKQSLRRLWRAELSDQQTGNAKRRAVMERPDAAQAFIDKSFQIRFRVSPPVRSDWRDFFSKKLSEALPSHASEEESYLLYQIYHQSRDTAGRVTPRDIVLFLNQLGALHRQVGHDSEIPFEMQAVFAAFQDQIRSGSQLAEEEVVPSRLNRLLGKSRWREYLAALYYNVELDKSLQILIGEDVEEALSEGDPDKLEEHQGVPGFSEVCVDRLELKLPEWRESEPTAIGRAALTVDGLKKPLSSGSSERFWRSLRETAAEVDDWSPFDVATGKGMVAILEHTVSQERGALQHTLLKRVSTSCPTDAEDESALESWVEGAVEVVKGIHKGEEGSSVSLTVPGGPELYVQVLELLQDSDLSSERAACFTTSAGGSELVDVLQRRVTEGDVEPSMADNVVFMDGLELVADWNPLGSTVAQQLRANETVPPAKLRAYCLLLEELAKKDSIPGSHMEQMTHHGHLHHRLWEANQANNPRAMAACALPILVRNPSGQQQKNIGHANNGQSLYQTLRDTPEKHEEVVRELVELVARFGYASKLLEDDKYRKQAPNLTSWMLAEFLMREEATNYVSARLLLGELPYLSEHLDSDELDQVLRRYGAESTLYEHAANLEVDESTAPLHSRVYGANAGRPESHDYEERLVRGLQAVPQDQWDQQLDSEGELLQLALQLLEEDADLTLKTEFRRALQDHLTRVLGGKTTPEHPENWTRLLDALEDHAQSTLLGQVVDQLTTPSAGQLVMALRMYGEVLLTYDEALHKEAEDVIGNLCTALVQRHSTEGTKWIRRLLEECPQVWRTAPEDRKQVLKDDLETELRDTDPSAEVYDDLRAVATEIGVELSDGDGSA